MDKNFLDYTGLTQYTKKLEDFILNKLSVLVPNTRKVNDKSLSSDITLTAEDVNALPDTWSPDLSGYVPTTRTVNGKPLSSDIALSAFDISALPTSGGTLTGDLRIKGNDNYGTKINLGDGDHVHISEPTDDCLEIKAKKVNFVISDTTDEKFTVNGVSPFGASDVDLSAYAPKKSPIFIDSISMGRKEGTAVGDASVAVGSNVEASGMQAHAEGSGTTASAQQTHAEGYKTTASTICSHAEGSYTTARGMHSHAEGYYTTASNYASHASGKYSKAMIDNGLKNDTYGDAFVIGNGTDTSSLSNALRLAYEGTLYLTKAYNSTGADYAEYFEWLDGNPNNEDRVGRFVTLEGNKIKLAQEGDYILGVISGQPCVIGNADEDWLGRWEHDDFNRFVKEYLVHTETEVFPPNDVANDEALQQWLIQNDIQERDGHYFKMEVEVVDYPTDSWRHKANPSYDPSQSYIERKDRQEWDAVGMVGVLSVIDDGTCEVNGYAKVGPNGVATKADSLEFAKSWRVISRVSDTIIKIIFSV